MLDFFGFLLDDSPPLELFCFELLELSFMWKKRCVLMCLDIVPGLGARSAGAARLANHNSGVEDDGTMG